MKGLLLKDLLSLKKQGKFLGLLFVFYLVMALNSDNPYLFLSIVSIMTVMLTMTSMAYDERSHWERYALTMPLARNTIVFSKYILALILVIGADFLSFLLLMLMKKTDFIESILYTFAMMGASLIFISLILPILFRYGVEKGRLLMMAILFTPTIIIVLGSRMGLTLPELPQVKPLFVGILLSGAILMIVLSSLAISIKIYQRKAF